MRAASYRQPLTGIILAGGKASRMGGRAKPFLKINKKTLISIQLSSLRKVFKKIIIVTNSRQRYRNLKGVELVPDIIAGIGPLGGIYSGLLASKSFYNFVVACDMPFINTELIKHMFAKAPGYDIVIPKIDGRHEPLFCIYSKACILSVSRMAAKKIFKIKVLLPLVKVKEITKKEVLSYGNPEKIFVNINTARELKKYK
jgi:molybdenum cofactor guanylyltransferase